MANDLLHPSPLSLISAARGSVGDLLKPALTGSLRDARRPRVNAAPPAVPRTDFDPTLPENIANPYPELQRLREHPVVVNEELGVWMMGRYADVHAAARDNDTLTSRDGVLLRSFPAQVVVFADPPDHTRLRQVAAPMFNKRAVREMTSDIRDLAIEGVAALGRGEIVDAVSALAIPLPINVIATMLGVPRDQWPGFRAISDHFAQIFSPRSAVDFLKLIGTGLPAYVRFRSFVEAEMRSRAIEPANDLITRLGAAEAAGDLSDTEALLYSLILLVAGNETTTNLLGMLLLKLAQDPELFAELKEDRSLLPAAVEETARWGSPVQWVTRTLTAPYRVGDVVIPKDSRVVLFLASANRDPAKFPDPDRFDVHRDTTGHLAFGHGLHFCLGAQLARLEAITAIDQLLDEVDGVELAGPVRWATTPSLQGPASLPVRIRRR